MSCSVHQEAYRWFEENKASRANFEKVATTIAVLATMVHPASILLVILRKKIGNDNRVEIRRLMEECAFAEDPDTAKGFWDLAKKVAGSLP